MVGIIMAYRGTCLATPQIRSSILITSYDHHDIAGDSNKVLSMKDLARKQSNNNDNSAITEWNECQVAMTVRFKT